MTAADDVSSTPLSTNSSLLFEKIASDLTDQGYSINPGGLPEPLATELLSHIQQLPSSAFNRAGVGRQQQATRNRFVRRDAIRWIENTSPAESAWLAWTQALQTFLNRRLFLGLFSFESHFALYQKGDFYKKHVDAFKGDGNRILSIVTYLNPGWLPSDGGELVLYQPEQVTQPLINITPAYGTIALFLSESFPHEVLAAQRDRYSIAGWFRVNASINGQIDPPR
jgi:SM-20-related protein